MKTISATAALLFFVFCFCSQASALGYDIKINTENDRFDNSGDITAYQKVSGGVAVQKIGQRVIAPADWNYEYNSHDNKYINSGTIHGDQHISSGAANQAVGQEVN